MPRLTGRGRLHTLICERCQRSFETRGAPTRFCSRECARATNTNPRTLPPATITCRGCGKTVTVVGSKVKVYTARGGKIRMFCSKSCYDDARRMVPPTFVCARCGKTTPRKLLGGGGYNYLTKFCSRTCANAAQIKSEGYIHKRTGYRMMRGPDGRSREEHRILMEEMIGRALVPGETIHHKNGQRADNRRENLELWDTRNPKGQRLEDKLAWCSAYLLEHGVTSLPYVEPRPTR